MSVFSDLGTSVEKVGVWLLHVILILPIAGLKALDTGIQHLIIELSKV